MEKFRILALESSAKSASCALSEGGKIIAHYYQNNGLTHSTVLMPMVQAMLEGCGISAAEIDLFAVAQGPGSFTGIRIGVAAAKGLMWAANKEGVGVSTLEAMAWNCRCMEGCVICAAMDARRSQIYNALFEIKNSEPVRLCEDRAISLKELIEDIKKYKNNIFVVGDGAELCYNALSEANIACTIAPGHMRYQNAVGVALAAEGAQRKSASELNPVYLRLSQAERERLEKENNK